MNEEKKTIKVEIFGNEYFIKAGESTDSEYIKTIADYVDEKMRDVSQATSIISSSKIAILAALNITDELFKIKKAGKINIIETDKPKKKTTTEKIIKMFEEVGI